jgi:DNA-binding NtrC family response regulator
MPRHLKLLVVDAEGRFLQTIATRLRMRGFDVWTASNGAEALRISDQEKFDLALVDLKMPGLDGSQVLRALKDRHRHLEGIILTGHGSLEGAVDLARLGAQGCLPKPFELEQLLEAILVAYTVRLKKKFASDPEKLAQIAQAERKEPRLAALKALADLDDEER